MTAFARFTRVHIEWGLPFGDSPVEPKIDRANEELAIVNVDAVQMVTEPLPGACFLTLEREGIHVLGTISEVMSVLLAAQGKESRDGV